MKLRDAFDAAGKPFAYYPKLAKVFGSVKTAVYFCALIWRDTDRAIDCDDDVFIKTQNQICDETGLTFEEAKSCKANLVKRGIIKCEYDRLNHFSRLKVDWEIVEAIYEAWGENHHAQKVVSMVEKPPSGRGDSHRRSLYWKRRRKNYDNSCCRFFASARRGLFSKPRSTRDCPFTPKRKRRRSHNLQRIYHALSG